MSATRALVVLTPRLPATGATTTVRLAGGGGRAPFYHGGQHYRAGVTRLPRFSSALEFGEAGWTGGTTPRTGVIVFKPGQRALLDQLAGLYWPGTAVTVDTGPEEGPFVRAMTGTVAAANVDNGALQLTIADLSYGLDRKTLVSRFLGTSGIEGISEAGGRIKRRSWGEVTDIECRILDKAFCIYEVGDPAFPLDAIAEVRDKGRAGPITVLGWQGSIAATFAALKAAVAPDGGGVVAPSIACLKWWTTASGPLCADLRGEIAGGYVDLVADIAARVLAAMGGPALTNQVAMRAARPGPAGLHLGDADETIAQALDRLLLGVSLLWALDPAGTITLREIGFGAPVETIRSSDVSRLRQLPPHRARRIGYQRNHKQHGDGEISLAIDAAKQVKLISNRTVLTYDSAGRPLAGQSIVVTATRVNSSADIIWALRDRSGNDRTALLAIAGDTATLSTANFELARAGGDGVVFIASITDGGTVSDQLSVGVVSNGAAALGLSVSADRSTIIYDASGAISPAVQPTTLTATRQNSAAPVTWHLQRLDGTLTTAAFVLSGAPRENLIPWSQRFDQWGATAGALTVTPDTTTAPDGSLTADTIADTSATDHGQVQQIITIPANTFTYRASIWIRKTTDAANSVLVRYTLTSAATGAVDVVLNTNSGRFAVTPTGAGAGTGQVDDYGTFWRVRLKLVNANNTSARLAVFPAVGPNAGDGPATVQLATATGSAIVWGAQITAQADDSYIPTQAASNLGVVVDSTTFAASAFETARGATEGVVAVATILDNGAFVRSAVSIVRQRAGAAGIDGTDSRTPSFDPAQWRRDGRTFTRMVSGFNLAKPLTSAEAMPFLSASWTILNTDKRQLMGLTNGTDAYALYAFPGDGTILWVKNPAGTGEAFGVAAASYTIGQRLTVVHRGTFIQALIDGLEVYRWEGFSTTTAWKAYGLSPDIGGTLANVAVAVAGEDGNKPDLKFMRSNAPPAPATGADPVGWFDGDPGGDGALWMIRANKTYEGTLIGTWSAPKRISGISTPTPYDPATTYYEAATVTLGGGTYILAVDSATGQAPSGTAQSNTYWDVLAAPGEAGAPATPPAPPTGTINLTSAAGVNLRTLADAAGYTGASNATYTFVVPAGVVIRGLSGSSKSIDTGTWPSGFTISLSIVVQSGGVVDGGGGVGGGYNSGINGSAGGDAIYCRVPCNVTIDAGGIVRGGGGGGGRGRNKSISTGGEFFQIGGGGGGGGAPTGRGGASDDTMDVPGGPGSNGTTSGGGAGGAPGSAPGGANPPTAGAAGGTFATAGGNASGGGTGGAAGYAVRKNGNSVTVTNNGTMTGTAA